MTGEAQLLAAVVGSLMRLGVFAAEVAERRHPAAARDDLRCFKVVSYTWIGIVKVLLASPRLTDSVLLSDTAGGASSPPVDSVCLFCKTARFT